MKKSSLLRLSFGLVGLMGAGGAVAGPMALSSKNAKSSLGDSVSAQSIEGHQGRNSLSLTNPENTDGTSLHPVINGIDTTSNSLVAASPHEGGRVLMF